VKPEIDEREFTGTTRFEVRRRIGAGSFGVVYEAFDRERGAVVALKALHLRSSEAIYRFKREFRALADIVHPNLVLLYDLLSTGDRWFYTMERVEGVPFIERVRPTTAAWGRLSQLSTASASGDAAAGPATFLEAATAHEGAGDPEGSEGPGRIPPPPLPPLDEGRLRGALLGLASGIEALHAAGKLHRDLKPSNVLVTPAGRVVILDFGVVAEIDQPDTSGGVFGTPAYMSPEQAVAGPPSPASDWYCVGVMLYLALTGVLPYSGRPTDVLLKKMREDAPPPETRAPGLPPDLAALCRALLRRDPAARPTGREILRRLRAGASPAGANPAAASERLPPVPIAPSSPFVGRERELSTLLAAFEETNAGRAVAVRVHGHSGIGKSGLIRRFLDEVSQREPEAVVLAGRCFERESVPYKALDTVVDALSRHLETLPRDEVEALLPADVPALTRLFPVLKRSPAVAAARRRVTEPADPTELRRRAFAAFRGLLVRLAARAPLVIAIDDLQWGDADGARLLHDALKPPDPPPLLLVAVHRSEEASAVPVVEALRDLEGLADAAISVREVVVAELPLDEARRLAESLLGPTPDATARARAIADESRGNPLFVDELVRHALEARAGAHVGPGAGPGGAAAAGAPAAGLAPSRDRLDDAIRARVAGLPEGARKLIETISIAGRPIEARTACRAAGLEGVGLEAERVLASAHLARARALRSPDDAPPGAAGERREVEEIEAYHDRVREAVASGLEPEARRAIHARLATALQDVGDADPETLAAHFEGAGDRAAAAGHVEEAARRAAFALAFDRAARLYGRALELSAATGERARDLETRRGEALANARRPAEAAAVYLAAAEGAGGRQALELRRRAAELLLMGGDIDRGLAVVRAVLGAVGLALPGGRLRALLELLWLRARVRLRGLGFVARTPDEVAEDDLRQVDAAWSAAAGLGAVDLLRGAVLQTRQLLLALAAGEPFRIARALALESVYVSGGGVRWRERAAAASRAAADLAAGLDHPYASAFATLCAGGTAFNEGRFRDAAAALERAVESLRDGCEGATWELGQARAFLIGSLYYLGEWGEISRRAPALLDEALERGDRNVATILRNRGLACAFLAADAPERARRELLSAPEPHSREGPQLQNYRAFGARVEIDLYEGRAADALRTLSDGWALVRRSVAWHLQVYRLEARDLKARVALAAAAAAGAGSRHRASLLRLALGEARRIERERAPWALPLAALARAGAAALGDDADRARAAALLDAAARGLSGADLRLHAAAARRRRGELAGGPEGRDLVSAADALMAEQGIRNPARVADLLAPGRYGGRRGPGP